MLNIGEFCEFPSEALWNAAIDTAKQKGISVYESTDSLRRYKRFPCLKMGRYGLAGFRPEGLPEEEDFVQLGMDDFFRKLLVKPPQRKTIAAVTFKFEPADPSGHVLQIGDFVFSAKHAKQIVDFIESTVLDGDGEGDEEA